MYNGMYQRIVRYLRHLVDRPRCEACNGTTLLWLYATDRYVCDSCAWTLGYHEFQMLEAFDSYAEAVRPRRTPVTAEVPNAPV